MAQKISGLTALSTTYADTDLLEVSVDTGGGTFVSRKMTFLQLRTAFTKLQANLDVNSFQITSVSNGNIIIRPNGSGAVLVGGNSTQATELRFMEDSDNGTNYVALKVADALAASTTYTLPTADGTSGQLLSTNGTGTLSWATAGGGLTEFTEAETTAAPNATVPVNSLTPVTATTNADFAIKPKGNGAILAAIPDNTATGGNKRGANSVDLQTYRTVNDRVASGQYSTVIGGGDSRATASYAIAGGNVGIAGGTSSTALQGGTTNATQAFAHGSNTASGAGSTALGGSVTYGYNTASGEASFAGHAGTASGAGSFAFGEAVTANGVNSQAWGFRTISKNIYASTVIGSGHTTAGDGQQTTVALTARTTGNTATTLTVRGLSAADIYILSLLNNSASRFKGTIIGKKSGTTDVAAWDVDGLIVRGANAASTTLALGNVTLVQNTPAWGTPTLAADTTNGGLRVQVTGAAATNIQWTAIIDSIETLYA